MNAHTVAEVEVQDGSLLVMRIRVQLRVAGSIIGHIYFSFE